MNKFKELWSDDRTNALIKIGLWFIFLIFVLIICSISGGKETQPQDKPKEEPKTITYKDMLNNMIHEEYFYEYVITNIESQEKSKYTGTYGKDVDEGLYEDKEQTYKYSCRIDKCFKVFIDHEEEFEFERPIYTNISEIISSINNMSPKDTLNNTIHEYDSYNLYIKIINNEESIEKIEIKDGLNEYEMTFR